MTEDERLPYMKRIYDAIINLDKALDLGEWVNDARRFIAATDARGVHPDPGLWGLHPADIEAIAHEVVDTCIDLHSRGATGLPMARIPAFREHNKCDWNFTFAQRIYFMSLLLKHFKFAANQVMQSNMTLRYLARIWSTLMEQVQFCEWWGALSKEQKALHLGVFPYEGVPVNALTSEEKQQFEQEHKQEQQQRVQQALQRQTQKDQIATKTKRPATVLDSSEPGPSRKRRNPLASADQGAVFEQPQPRRVSRQVEAGGLLNFRSSPASDGGEEAFGEPLTKGIYSKGRPMGFDELLRLMVEKPAQQPPQDILADEIQALLRTSPSPPLPQIDDKEHGSLFDWNPSGDRDEDSLFQEGAEGAEGEVEVDNGYADQMDN
jgi:hypothetical protein